MEKEKLPAIVVIGYNRPRAIERLLKSIQEATYRFLDITLVISIDYWKENNPVVKIANDFEWKFGEKIVIEHHQNMGLREHVLFCGDLSERYGAVILLEDDLTVSRAFYEYAYDVVKFYKNDMDIAGIGLYSVQSNGYASAPFVPIKGKADVYFTKDVITWGEIFIERQWKQFRKWYGTGAKKLEFRESMPEAITNWSNNAWSKYFAYFMDDSGTWFVSPYVSFTTNCSEVGEHNPILTSAWQVPLENYYHDCTFCRENDAVKYDAYFENVALRKNVLDEEEVVVDLYGIRSRTKRRYMLTTQILPYKVIKQYALFYRPQELNIIKSIQGNEIFLYDLSEKGGKKINQFEHTNRITNYYYPMLNYKRCKLRWMLGIKISLKKFILRLSGK